ncbi:MAG: NUDIX domain-containing protein, partial [Halobacteriales archaeon]
PGGERDPGESHEVAAVRAAERETGLDLSLGPRLASCRYAFVNEDTDDRVIGRWDWFGANDDGGRARPADTVISAGWFTELPDDVEPAVADAAREWIDGGRNGADEGETDGA